ncbi:MAG: hypothetical protein JWN98_2410 [Abditibacteriota bacterium]|nr:hypothetical protein [Abditibacteriota bacterium]
MKSQFSFGLKHLSDCRVSAGYVSRTVGSNAALLIALLLLLSNTAQAAKVSSAVLCKGYDGGPVNIVKSFKASDRELHAVVKLDRISSGDKLKAVWVMVDTSVIKNYELLKKEMTTRRMNIVHFSAKVARDWPKGKYRTDIFLNGKLVRRLPFLIQ